MDGGNGPGGKAATNGIGGHGEAVGYGGLDLGSVMAVKSVDSLVVAARSGMLWWATRWPWADEDWAGDGRNLGNKLALGALP